jgi:hypothetical protein
MDESHGEKISRIDANVKILLSHMPLVQELKSDSDVNKTEHKIAKGLIVIASTPIIFWICKKLGLAMF